MSNFLDYLSDYLTNGEELTLQKIIIELMLTAFYEMDDEKNIAILQEKVMKVIKEKEITTHNSEKFQYNKYKFYDTVKLLNVQTKKYRKPEKDSTQLSKDLENFSNLKF